MNGHTGMVCSAPAGMGAGIASELAESAAVYGAWCLYDRARHER